MGQDVSIQSKLRKIIYIYFVDRLLLQDQRKKN